VEGIVASAQGTGALPSSGSWASGSSGSTTNALCELRAGRSRCLRNMAGGRLGGVPLPLQPEVKVVRAPHEGHQQRHVGDVPVVELALGEPRSRRDS